MNGNLSPLVSLGSQVFYILSNYVLPIGIAVALVALILLLLFGRGKNIEPVVLAPVIDEDLTPEDNRIAVLVVDDSAVARAKLSKLFAVGGYRVELAVDGVEAMEKMSHQFYSVLITDLEMPNMNGLELIAAVMGNMDTDDMPIIAITGHDELQAKVHDYQGLYGIFKKPWNDRELLKRVEALASLRKPRLAAVI